MMKNHKNFLTRIFTLMTVFSIFLLTSCGDDDDEAPMPTVVQFESGSATVAENNTAGVDVVIDFNGAVKLPGTVEVHIGGTAVAGEDYTISPAPTGTVITVDVLTGESNAVINITPIDNTGYQGSRTVTLSLMNAEVVQIGEVDEMTLTINDDDMEPTSIADVRTMFGGTAVDINEDMYVEGVVTSVGSSQSSLKNLFIQDETGGIAVRFTADHTYAQGTMLRINMNGAEISEFRGLLQINNADQANVTDLGDAPLPAPQVITIAELNSGAYEGQLVTLQDVYYTGADGVNTFDGNRTLTNGTDEANSRVEEDASFSGDILPLGRGNVTGIAGEFDEPQLLIQARSDVFENDPSGTISTSVETLTFGSVDNGGASASQSYTVSFDGDITQVNVTAPNHFEISLDDTQFTSNTVTVLASGATVYVRFAPTSGNNGDITGAIAHTAFAAMTETVAVSGTEAGNDTGDVTPDLFISEYAEGSSNNKYIELYNPTDSDLDLANYKIMLAANGGEYNNTLELAGTLAAGATYVIANASSDAEILAESDVTSNVTFYNGDDALGLFKSDGNGEFVLIDVIGIQSEDPGSSWDAAGVTGATAEHTLVRKPNVLKGNTDWASSAGTDAASSEWIVLDQNDWTDLGVHTTN